MAFSKYEIKEAWLAYIGKYNRLLMPEQVMVKMWNSLFDHVYHERKVEVYTLYSYVWQGLHSEVSFISSKHEFLDVFSCFVCKNVVFVPYWFLHKSLQLNLYGLQCVCLFVFYLNACRKKYLLAHSQKNTKYEIHCNPWL